MQKTTVKTKLLTGLLVLCMILSLMPITTLAVDTTVKSESELEEALKNEDYENIKLGGNIEISSELNVKRTVTLDLNGYTLSSICSTGSDIFIVCNSGNLTVKDSGTGGTIDGKDEYGKEKYCGFNVNGGILTLEGGSIVNCADADGDGGAVDVANNGKFIMNGGTIKDCKVDDDGAAVDIGSGCTFIMNDGTISNCSAGDDGGAVNIKRDGFFVMNGGVIEKCSATNIGGAVKIEGNGSFTMTGGIINNCQASENSSSNALYGEKKEAIVVISGGTIENCGVFPWPFNEFTVSFDSDGGSAVVEQKVLNSSAVKPNDPKKDGYNFAGWYMEDNTMYNFDTKVAANITLKAKWTSASSTPINITKATVENVRFSYQAGSNPQATATVATIDIDKYKIVYECWQQFEDNKPIAAWYSDNGLHGNLPSITEFENGKKYVYSIMLEPKDGYCFSGETVVTVNGQKVSAPFVGGSMYIPSIKTITPTKQIISEYKITEGANGSWTQGDNSILKFIADGNFSKFTGVKVDGTLLTVDEYTATSGSTVITLKKDYLDTLSVGKHTLTVVYNDGECSTEFEIKMAQSGGSEEIPGKSDEGNTTLDEPNQNDSKSPQTGDNSNLISGSFLVGITVLNKKKELL